MYVNVMANSFPDFTTSMRTTWLLKVGNETTPYYLPPIADKEGNDEPEVFIQPTPAQRFPPFMSYDENRRLITF